MISVGMVLPGFCNGYFGRDSYEDKTVEAFGFDWIVARDRGCCVHFALFENQRERDKLVAEWSKESKEA